VQLGHACSIQRARSPGVSAYLVRLLRRITWISACLLPRARCSRVRKPPRSDVGAAYRAEPWKLGWLLASSKSRTSTRLSSTSVSHRGVDGGVSLSKPATCCT